MALVPVVPAVLVVAPVVGRFKIKYKKDDLNQFSTLGWDHLLIITNSCEFVVVLICRTADDGAVIRAYRGSFQIR